MSEHDVLQALVFDDPEEDRILPIIGESGTGKSHLVRWLHANIPPADDRHVVYIEKRETGLRQVVHRILDGLDGPQVLHRQRFIDLRGQIDAAAAGLNPDTAGLRLLNELAMAIREHGLDNAAGDEDRDDREELIEKGLPDLLTDREFRVPLLADGGVIATTVARLLGGGTRDGEAPAFEKLELDVRDALDAGRVAQKLRSDLYADPSLRALAITMMNEQLTHALAALIDVGRTQIYEVMLNIREALLEEGKTLILLVEDFALLRGVETQLLDAMIAEPDPGGKRTLCPMRSALAVTSGYFEGKDTALTRIHFRGGYVYSLDAELGEGASEVDADYVQAFVATYLNAVRVGRDRLERSFDARTPGAGGDRSWVNNACEGCSYIADCHAAFGSAEGYGLYPFNELALDRIVSSQISQFDPRYILKILDTTLRTQRSTILDGAFPDPDWASEYDQQQDPRKPELPHLPAAVATTYEELDSDNAERRKTLVTFWGGVPRRAVNLSATIHEAFDLPELPSLEREDTPSSPSEAELQEREKGTTSKVDKPPVPVESREASQQDLDDKALDLWGRGKVLEQKLANEVRRALATAVRGAREWSALGVDPKAFDQIVGVHAFSLGDQAKGEGSTATRIIGRLEPSDANAFLLQGVLAAERIGDWSFDRGLDRLLQFSELVDEWADEAMSRIRAAEPTSAAAHLVLLSGAVLGIAAPCDDERDLLASLFNETAFPAGESNWAAFQKRLVDGPSGAASRGDLIAMVGTGGRLFRATEKAKIPIGIDAGPLLAAIAELSARDWEVPSKGDLAGCEQPVRHYADALRRDLVNEVDRHLEALAVRRSRALALLGDERDPSKLVTAIDAAYGAARDNGIAGAALSSSHGILESRFRDADLRALDELTDLERINELAWPEKLALVAAGEKYDLGSIDGYLDWADRQLRESMERAEAHLAGGDGSGETSTSITAEVLKVLRGTSDELAGASG